MSNADVVVATELRMPGDRRCRERSGLEEVDPDMPSASEGSDDGPQRSRGSAATADDLAQVIGMDPDLEDSAAPKIALTDLYVAGMLDDPLDEVLEGFLEHLSPRSRL